MRLAVTVALALALAGCEEPPAEPGVDAGAEVDGGYDWQLPPGFPLPRVPADNPMSTVKVELGRRLFYDTRLSGNQTQSCASCHEQARAFTDGRAHAVGSTGETHRRSSMGLGNVAWNATLTWANPLLASLEEQALVPMFGEHPVELGLAGLEDALLARLRAEPVYQSLFPAAFPELGDPFTLGSVTRALAAFERALITGRSTFDRAERWKDGTRLSASAARGKALFFGEELECFHCHGGFNFSDSEVSVLTTFDERPFHNTGLYNLGGTGAYPAEDQGALEITEKSHDMGHFRAPSLRNIALTAPYMHDGSIATLDEVLDHYAAGGRTIASGPNAGVGAQSPFKSQFLAGFTLTAQQRQDVLAFLNSLTDEEFVSDPRFADPWK